MNNLADKDVLIIGAGPAGLSAGYELARSGLRVTILEKSGAIGGLCRTTSFGGCLFDVGPHRFFTDNKEIEKLWRDLLGDNFNKVPRLTRIFYRQKYFSYPVKPFEVLTNLGLKTSTEVMWSYFKTLISGRRKQPKNHEEWISQNFCPKLFQMFFKNYTEKVWGIPCTQIEAEWADERIKNLSFWSTLKHALGFKRQEIRSLIEEFDYPRLGTGMMYEAIAKIILDQGGRIVFNQTVNEIKYQNQEILCVMSRDDAGQITEWPADYFFSSMPLTASIKRLTPAPPAEIEAAAQALYFRAHISVNLILKRPNFFPDNWIYIHEPSIKMARVANYANFSSAAAPNHVSPISCEYFVFKDDAIWQKADEELKNLAIDELGKLFKLKPEEIADGYVNREEFAYPVYYIGYQEPYDKLKNYITAFNNFQPIGRGGMYRYFNQDQAILTGLLAARNLLGDKNNLWQVGVKK